MMGTTSAGLANGATRLASLRVRPNGAAGADSNHGPAWQGLGGLSLAFSEMGSGRTDYLVGSVQRFVALFDYPIAVLKDVLQIGDIGVDSVGQLLSFSKVLKDLIAHHFMLYG